MGNYNNKNRNNNNGRNNYDRSNYKRTSGCEKGSYTNASGETRPCLKGWRIDPYTRNGWQNALAVPLHDPEPANGNTAYENWIVTIKDSHGVRKFNGIKNKAKGFVTIPDLGLIMTPNGKGSFGQIKKSR